MIRLTLALTLLATAGLAQEVPHDAPLQCFSILQKSPVGRPDAGMAPELSLTSVTGPPFEADTRITAAEPADGTVSLQGTELTPDGRVLGCVLRMMRVMREGGDDLTLFARTPEGEVLSQGTPFPVLTFGVFAEASAFQRAASAWDAGGGTLPLDLAIPEGARGAQLAPDVVGETPLLTAAPGAEGVTSFTLDAQYPATLVEALGIGEGGLPTLVLCRDGCEAMRRASEAPPAVAESAPTESAPTEPDPAEPASEAVSAEEATVVEPDVEPAPHADTPGTLAETRPILRATPPETPSAETADATPAASETAAPPVDDPDPDPGTLTAQLSYLTPDGEESAERVPDLGGLACILDALGADIFTASPECAGPGPEALARQNALIDIADDGRWVITPGAREAVVRVTVTLPPGASAQTCLMSLAGADGGTALEPVIGADPARFTADVSALSLAERGVARFRIETPTPGACGAPGRAVALPVAPELTIPLQEEALPQWAVAHLLAPHAVDVAETLGPAPAVTGAFGAALIDAVESAHVRLHAATTDRPTTLSRAALVMLDGRASDTERLALSFESLRQAPAARFATLDAAARMALGQGRPVLSRDDIGARLTALRATATAA
ncbi:MAG: hypothetical protein ACU0DW_09045, partial [Shimia sp.]